MFVCYLDESGVPENAGTPYFVLVGLAIEAQRWKTIETEISSLKAAYGLQGQEIHTAWMARRFTEQERIPDFDLLPCEGRRREVEQRRMQHLLRLAASGTRKQLDAAKKNYRKTAGYVHLTRDERLELIRQLADTVAGWQDSRLFAEVIDKQVVYAQPNLRLPPFEFAFTELIQRYEYFLRHRGHFLGQELLGFIVQDNNETVARRLTEMMIRFHREGTRWTDIDHIFETPLFVNSELTSMVQMADLCGYAIRRYYENGEADLFERIYQRFDRTPQGVVGIRHFTAPGCSCRVCSDRSTPLKP